METEYIARISYGKDSLKMLDVIHSRGLPLDRITTPELKPCPFCGANAKLLHSGIEKTRSRDNGDLITSWRVLCQNCGTEQKGGVSEYVFNSDETISLKDPHFDGRSQAIKAWNRRAVPNG